MEEVPAAEQKDVTLEEQAPLDRPSDAPAVTGVVDEASLDKLSAVEPVGEGSPTREASTSDPDAVEPPGVAAEAIPSQSSTARSDAVAGTEQIVGQLAALTSDQGDDKPVEQEPTDGLPFFEDTAAQEHPEMSGETEQAESASPSVSTSQQQDSPPAAEQSTLTSPPPASVPQQQGAPPAVEQSTQPSPPPASLPHQQGAPPAVEQSTQPTPLFASVPISPRPGPVELSKEERALRGLLQFFVCADARRQSGGVAGAPLQMRYRELILAGCDMASTANSQPDALTSTAAMSTPSTMDIDEAAPAADAPVVALDTEGVIPMVGGLAAQLKSGMNKEQLRQQLLAKQQSLEREVQRLRRKRDQAAQVVPPAASAVEDDPYPTPVDNESSDEMVMPPAPKPKPPPPPHPAAGSPLRPSRPPPPPRHPLEPPPRSRGTKRSAEFPASRSEQEALLRKKLQDLVEAEIEEERLSAKKHALEDLHGSLQKELAGVRGDRAKAAKLAAARKTEEVRIHARLRKALASSLELPFDDGAILPATAGS